jgi:hypothetical protein
MLKIFASMSDLRRPFNALQQLASLSVALGQPRRFRPAGVRSAYTPKAAVTADIWLGRDVPRTDSRSATNKFSSFDHLVSLGEQQYRDVKAEGVSGLEIDHQFYLGALLDWEVSRLGALENFSDIDSCLLM